MERIFNNSNGAVSFSTGAEPSDDIETYQAFVKSMIDDTTDYEESFLGPIREQNQAYYYGELPKLDIDEDEDPEDIQQSTAVSTDVRDTVMAIMPSLMRTIVGGASRAVQYVARNSEGVALAEQATDYVHYKFYEENNGFLTLHGAIKDCLTVKVGVITWWSDFSHRVEEKTFTDLHSEQLAVLMDKAAQAGMQPEIVDNGKMSAEGILEFVTIKYLQSNPDLKIVGVPPEEFRISRRAKTVDTADVIGRQSLVRASELIAQGFDKDMILEYAGASPHYAEERYLRNGGADEYDVVGDLVDYGEYYVLIDSDGDGINELHWIKTIGDNHLIIEDEIVSHRRYALFQSDPRSHTAIGDCPADLVLEIQDIKTNILRGSLDSLADILNPRTVVNETLTNMSDVLSTDRGAIIRTKGDPSTAVAEQRKEFVGMYGFQMMDQIDKVRQARTGISEASKGMDPKALQSMNVIGVDAVVTGAQERTELIARILTETGVKDLFKGLLREITENPNPAEMVPIRGKYVQVDPSLFDANMKTVTNPSIGKGSDQQRLQSLMAIKQDQSLILQQFGFNNPVVSIEQYLNTTEDILSLANIKDMSRYFTRPSPEQMQEILNAPKEPTPEMLIAQAEVEGNKKDVVIEMSKNERAQAKMILDDDFRRDKLNVDTLLGVASIFKDMSIAQEQTTEMEQRNDEPRSAIGQ